MVDSMVLAPLREGDSARTVTLSKKSSEALEVHLPRKINPMQHVQYEQEEPKKSMEVLSEYGTVKDETGICAKLNHNFPHIGRSLIAWPDNKMKERGWSM